MPLPRTDQDGLVAHLRKLGVTRGMALVVHTRLIAFGKIEGGEATVYAALREVVGAEGTIVVPTFTLWLEEGEAYDRAQTPSQRVGSFPEFVRTLPGARRSRCPMHNFAGVGPQATVLEQAPGTVSLGRGSDFEAMYNAGFHLLFLGCTFKDAATYTMHVEALVGVPFRQWLDLPRFQRGPDGAKVAINCRYYGRAQMDWHEELQVVEDHMMATGRVRREPCPIGHSYLMSIADFQSHVTRLLESDPYVTVRHCVPGLPRLPDVCERFLNHAQRRPDHPAVVSGDGIVTYGQLAGMVHRLTAAIARLGPEPRVLIHLPQQAEAYAAMFACGLAGAVYAPINTEAPLAKQQATLRRFAPDAIVGTRALFGTLVPHGDGPPLIDVESLPPAGDEPINRPGRLAYVIFTSGSSGEPKGVVISRAALACYVDWALRAMAVGPDDRWSQHPNVAFDLSVLDIYGALCGGATLYPLTGAKDRLMPALAIARNQLTIWNSVPSVMGLMIRAGQVTTTNFASLRLLTFCGEPLLPQHLEAIFAARPDVDVNNTYGPTEATVSCSLLRLRADGYRAACDASVAVGEAIDRMALHLIDGPSPDEGEVFIVGPQLAEGYWQDPVTTARAFCDRVIEGTTVRGYRTGDWFRRSGGNLIFVRRLDTQVKVSGHRLELEEVNAAIRRCGVLTACTFLVEGRLHAFLESEQATGIDTNRLRTDLRVYLDAHAVPAEFHVVPRLPRNANDKIDTLELANSLSRGAS